MLGITSREGEWEYSVVETRGEISFVFRIFFVKYEANTMKLLAFVSLSGRYMDVCFPSHYSVFKLSHNERINLKTTITPKEK